MSLPMSAARAVTEVVNRCESAKSTGYLDLSSCSLMCIADGVYMKLQDHEITKINIQNNALKKFPKKLLNKFPNTIIFNIEGNQLAEFPEELAGWTSMKGFSAANNQLEKFPEGVFAMAELTILDLSGNRIKNFNARKFFESCPGLKQLNLAGNPLEAEVVSVLKEKKPDDLVLKLE